jgi:hypothetical protein
MEAELTAPPRPGTLVASGDAALSPDDYGGKAMSSLMDGVFIKRRCYLKLGDGTILDGIRLRADCFFRHWALKDPRLDDEGWIRVQAVSSMPDRGAISEVSLRIDPMSGLLLEYSYTDDGVTRVFTLTNAEYRETTTRREGDAACGGG